MSPFTVYLARTGERQHVTAKDWQSALRKTGRSDACLLDKTTRPRTGRVSIDATFSPDSPQIITCRVRDTQTSDADLKSWALACVAHHLEVQS